MPTILPEKRTGGPEVRRAYESDFPYFNERQTPGLVYLVSWPEFDGAIVKAGITSWPKRWRRFVTHGATIEALWQSDQTVAVERHLLTALNELGEPAFTNREDSLLYLSGGGWLECYRLGIFALGELPELIEGVTSGLVQGR